VNAINNLPRVFFTALGGFDQRAESLWFGWHNFVIFIFLLFREIADQRIVVLMPPNLLRIRRAAKFKAKFFGGFL
jgi:hypothetical protein